MAGTTSPTAPTASGSCSRSAALPAASPSQVAAIKRGTQSRRLFALFQTQREVISQATKFPVSICLSVAMEEIFSYLVAIFFLLFAWCDRMSVLGYFYLFINPACFFLFLLKSSVLESLHCLPGPSH